VGYLRKVVVVLFMEVENHQEGEADLWEEVVDLQKEVEAHVCLSMLLG
jgi:hypothetical protein